MKRRTFLSASAAALASAGFPLQALAEDKLKLSSPATFSYTALILQAKTLSMRAYQAPSTVNQSILDQIDYDQHGKIKFNTDHALFKNGPGAFPITFFHLGKYFRIPVRMHVVDAQSKQSREIIYKDTDFDMPADSPAHQLQQGSGFAGFRFQESRLSNQSQKPWQTNDWVAFLGASYFRAIGDMYQYGLSARGIAINVADPNGPEEFPDFTQFYFVTPKNNTDPVVVYALLEGPSITGAYKFTMQRKNNVIIDVETSLFLRKDVARLGIAPATSMYWFSETVKATAIDWRPEVHDSDGLAMWTGSGEHIWRPLVNPPRTSASAFVDNNPKGFGLCQRDHQFDHYLDGVMYNRRPTLWVEPKQGWQEGSVQLIEIPTNDEIHDNIVAMWVPKSPAKAGNSYQLKYRLYWQKDEPFPSSLARCVATRLGNGGVPGQPRPQNVRKFVVEFIGKPLESLPFGIKPEAVLTTSRGEFSYVFTEPVPDNVPGHWRAQFDLTVDGDDPVDIRLYLKNGQDTLSETWLYQYHPFKTGSIY